MEKHFTKFNVNFSHAHTHKNFLTLTFEKPTANIILNGEKPNVFPKVRKKVFFSLHFCSSSY